MDLDKSILFFSDYSRIYTYKDCNLERKYYTCMYDDILYIYSIIMLYFYLFREINAMTKDCNNIKSYCKDDEVKGQSMSGKISKETISFDSITLTRDTLENVNKLLNSINITSYSLPIGSSFIIYYEDEYGNQRGYEYVAGDVSLTSDYISHQCIFIIVFIK